MKSDKVKEPDILKPITVNKKNDKPDQCKHRGLFKDNKDHIRCVACNQIMKYAGYPTWNMKKNTTKGKST